MFRYMNRGLLFLFAVGLFGLAPARAGDVIEPVLDEMVRTTLAARHRYREAKQALNDLVQGTRRYEEAQRHHKEAFEDYQSKAKQLDHERIRILARDSGESPQAIAHLREQGMGWGQIAHQLGVHPGRLGRGHHKSDTLESAHTHSDAVNQSRGRKAKSTKRQEHGRKGGGRGKGKNKV